MKTREKRSAIWKIPRDKLEEIVRKNNTLSSILCVFSLSNKGGNSKTLKRRLEFDEIDFSHISLGAGHSKGKRGLRKNTPLSEMMVEKSSFSRAYLKKRLLAENVLPNNCSICGINSIWNNETLVMVLDHINGVSNDNRIENLRFLCPNCNSQQSTFAGRHNKIDPSLRKKIKDVCPHCGGEKRVESKSCYKCVLFSKSHIEKPTKEQMQSDLKTMNWSQVGRKYSVAHTSAIRWAKSYGIIV